jgi:hypothetical protein
MVYIDNNIYLIEIEIENKKQNLIGYLSNEKCVMKDD